VVLVTVGVPGEYLTCTPEVAAVPWFAICNVSVNGAFTAAVDGPLRATERSGAPPAASAGLELAATTTATAPALKSSRRGPRATHAKSFIAHLPVIVYGTLDCRAVRDLELSATITKGRPSSGADGRLTLL
jgi:hypothetical protein